MLPSTQEGIPVLVKEVPPGQLPSNIQEYGYGFWLRYLTTYPTRQWSGKNAPSYFVARLTSNNPYGDTDFGDRILAIFQAPSGYAHYANHIANQPAQQTRSGQVDYPGDIEGVWTYIYFSYGKIAQRAVSFVQYADGTP